MTTFDAAFDLLATTRQTVLAGDELLASAKTAVAERVQAAGGIQPAQHVAHGFAWLATYIEALKQLDAWAHRLDGEGRLGETEKLITAAGFAEYANQIVGGIPMSQGEFIRPGELGFSRDVLNAYIAAAAPILALHTDKLRAALGQQLLDARGGATFGDAGLDDTDDMIRDQFRRFADEKVLPNAHQWHLEDELIPMSVIDEMSALGVFGLTIPEDFGGAGLSKIAMCIVSEELSRGYIGVGSLATRSEIAAELILGGGTDEQKAHWLPKLASGEVLPTAVFTEPNTGSDLGSLRTRAIREGDVYKITGNKTWITHAARTDLMTLLVRTNTEEKGYRGLTMFLATKPRGTDEEPFPAVGMSGGEIEVLGYRGMKEYEIAFDGFEVPAKDLLGGEEGQGFKQLMETFESARIQTAARAIGVAQCALELGLQYAQDRIQFGAPIATFPRVIDKLTAMAVEIAVVRQLTYFAGRAKDAGKRCDLEAGMAKLLAARVAWAAADNALQIHGGNGFALEYPISRVLCDARVLNIFEGAAEIQAQVIARRLLSDGGANA